MPRQLPGELGQGKDPTCLAYEVPIQSSERRILILAGSLPGKSLHIGQHSQNRWGICFLHRYAAAASWICAGLYGALDYSHLATALDILTPVNLALTHLRGSPGNVCYAIAECWTQPDLLHLNPASKIGDVDLFAFLIGVPSRALAQFLTWICCKCRRRHGELKS